MELERSWFVNQAYYYGAQNLQMGGAPGQGIALRQPRVGTRVRETFTANYTLVKVVKAIARLVALVPEFDAPPRSASFEDMLASDLAGRIFEYLKDATGFDSALRRVMWWAAVCGSGFLKVYFDKDAGEHERIWKDSAGNPVIEAVKNADLQRALEDAGQFKDVFRGEVRQKVFSPFHLKPDPIARGGGLDEAAYVILEYFTSPEGLSDMFGGSVASWATEGASTTRMWEDNIAFMSSPEGLAFGRSAVGTKNLCRYREFWERPLPRNDMKGRFIIQAGGKVVENGDNPYAGSRIGLPFVKYDWFPAEGRFWGVSLVEQIRRPQKAYNQARSHAIDFVKTYGWPFVMIPKGSAVKQVSLQAFPGVTLEYTAQAGMQPTIGQSPRISEAIPLTSAAAKNEMDEISAQAAPAKEGYPSQIRSGSAISMVQQDNNAILTPISHAMFESIARTGEMMLALVDSYYGSGRTIALLNDASEFEVMTFRSADLRHHHKLRVRGKPGMIESPEAYRQTLLDAVSIKALDPQTNARDRALFFRGMQMKTDLELLDLETVQVSRERTKIQKLIKGFPPEEQEPFPWEDPMIRLPVLEHFLNSSAFEAVDPVSKSWLVERWQKFTAILGQRMAAQQQMMADTKGAPSQKGVASQPSR